ncbi:glycosyltransferase [Tianweitania sediminis]|uniref:Uncharacterized protein n=1 Tax=Tianweitania sediminis TaxID=1502156 RepID=A0A8J7QYV8_9HYPH|nr:glycosyltransferase [Tianweitania sediminis]MBP0438515.1 hypothetical protein [Tianweitania sediminis]
MKAFEFADQPDAHRVRVLIIAPSDPEGRYNRASHAAFRLFKELQSDPQITPIFLALGDREVAAMSASTGLVEERSGEARLSVPPLDRFGLFSSDAQERDAAVERLVAQTRPDVIHLHHLGGLGLDSLKAFADLWIPAAVTLYGSLRGEEDLAQPKNRTAARFIQRRLVQDVLDLASFIFVPNALLARQIQDFLPAELEAEVVAPLTELPPSRARKDEVANRSTWRAFRSAPAAVPAVPRRFGFFATSMNAPSVRVFKFGLDQVPIDLRAQMDLGVYTPASLGDRTAGSKKEGRSNEPSAPHLKDREIRDAVSLCACVVVADLADSIAFTAVQEAMFQGIPVICPRLGEAGAADPTLIEISLTRRDVAETLQKALREALKRSPPATSEARLDRQAVQRHIAIYRALAGGEQVPLADVEPSFPLQDQEPVAKRFQFWSKLKKSLLSSSPA